MTIEALLFDMDGLLIDSEGLHMRAFAQIATELGFPSQPQDFAGWIGHFDQKMFDWLEEHCGDKVTPEEIGFIQDERYFYLLGEERPKPLPGVREMIDLCDEVGLKRGLVSSTHLPKLLKTMAVVLAHLRRPTSLEQTFQAIVTGDMVTNMKPAPDPYLQASQRLGLPPERCVAFEDSIAGVKSARAAGCYTVAIPNGHLDRDEVAAHAHACFTTLQEAFEHRIWEQSASGSGT